MSFTPTKEQLEELGFKKSKNPFTAQENGVVKYTFDEYYIFRKGGFYVDCIADERFHPTIVGQNILERFSLVHDGLGTVVHGIAYTNLYPQSLEDLKTLIKLLTPPGA